MTATPPHAIWTLRKGRATRFYCACGAFGELRYRPLEAWTDGIEHYRRVTGHG